MNQLALLHLAARRSVFTQNVRCPCDARKKHPRRPRSKNCRRLRQLGSEDHHQQGHRCHPSPPETVTRLREQVEALDRRLTLLDSVALVSRQNAQAAALRMAAMYHQLTSRGYDATLDETTTRFMYAMFAADVRTPDYTGRDVFMHQWEQLSLYHADIRIDTARIDALPTETLTAHGARRFADDVFVVRSVGTTTMRISRRTLECVFPHVLSDEPLVQWLIGKEYAFSYTLVMYLNVSGKVFQLESRIDLTSALLDLLHDPFATVKMITATTMTRAGSLLLQREVRDAQNTIENGFV